MDNSSTKRVLLGLGALAGLAIGLINKSLQNKSQIEEKIKNKIHYALIGDIGGTNIRL